MDRSSFVLDETKTSNEMNQPVSDVVNEEENLREENEEILKLILLYSNHKHVLPKTSVPDKSLHELTTDLPPPVVFRKKHGSGLRSQTKE